MRPISSSVVSGGSLAVALKALNFWDKADPWSTCSNFCTAVSERNTFDWFAFSLGLACGAVLCALIELLVALKAVVQAFLHRVAVPSEGGSPRKPLYKLL